MKLLPTLPMFRAWLALAAIGLVTPGVANAQDDPPGRVGRLAQTQGPVSWFDHEQNRWGAAEINRPLTGGDRVSTGAEGRAELRVGSSTLRLGTKTELEVLRLDDQRMVFQVHSGSLALRIRSRDIATEMEVLTSEARFLPQRAGHYRIDREDERSLAGVWRGSVQVVEGRQGSGLADGRSPSVETGQSLELWRDDRGGSGQTFGTLRTRWGTLSSDAFAAWVQREDQQDSRDDERSASRYVSPEMTGAEELDRHGRWDQHPEYGAIWLPIEVASDWAPYRHGRWTWVRPWGWTWVDNSRWGFAPFHYGRWVQWRGRWGWCPGEYIARPVFAPALVARVGGPHVGVTVIIGLPPGLPPVTWVPLAPRERYVPHYRHSPHYSERVNGRHGQEHEHGQRGHVQPVPTGPVMYGNQGVPAAVTPVSREVLLHRPAAPSAVIDTRRPQTLAPQPQTAPAPDTAQRPRRERGDLRVETQAGQRGDDGEVVDLRRARPPAPSATVVATPPAPAPALVAVAPSRTTATPTAVLPLPRPQRVDPARQSERSHDEGHKRSPESRQNTRERENQR